VADGLRGRRLDSVILAEQSGGTQAAAEAAQRTPDDVVGVVLPSATLDASRPQPRPGGATLVDQPANASPSAWTMCAA
jgi:pimeloyl-ACP methyl ester carboxylesterase